jgi:hypothetical protein
MPARMNSSAFGSRMMSCSGSGSVEHRRRDAVARGGNPVAEDPIDLRARDSEQPR